MTNQFLARFSAAAIILFALVCWALGTQTP